MKLKCLEARNERSVCSCERITAMMLSAGKRDMKNEQWRRQANCFLDLDGKTWPMMNVCEKGCVCECGFGWDRDWRVSANKSLKKAKKKVVKSQLLTTVKSVVSQVSIPTQLNVSYIHFTLLFYHSDITCHILKCEVAYISWT